MKKNFNKQISNTNSSHSETSGHEFIPVGNTNSLKGKLTTLDMMFDDIYNEMLNYKDELVRLQKEKDEFQADLQLSTKNDKVSLLKELDKVMGEMERHFEQQKEENKRLQLKIAKMKTSKTVLQGQLIALQRRITDLEIQVGNDEVKYD